MIVDVNINNKYIREDKVNTSFEISCPTLHDDIVYTRTLPRNEKERESFSSSDLYFRTKSTHTYFVIFTIIFCTYQKNQSDQFLKSALSKRKKKRRETMLRQENKIR